MPLRNGRFEEPGEHPGEAAHWTLTTSRAPAVCGFGVPAQGREDFERWSPLARRIDDVEVVRGFFGAHPWDDFGGWLAGPYLRAMPAGRLVAATLGPGDLESFGSGWMSGVFSRRWDEVEAVPASFAAGPEAFATGWLASAYVRQWSLVISAQALFGGGAESVERFAW
ncbi:MAG: hypothetical protein IPI49_19835 [Myxococcales bacterium]|nr:hypothetical protein [Myxococcales bacterium]